MRAAQGTVGVLTVNFGEPSELSLEAVIPFLERIFLQNAGLERVENGRARAEELARRRAPSLLDEYRAIGGSPLNDQAERQARGLESALLAAGYDVVVAQGYQFTRPFIDDGLQELREAGVDRVVVLPVYPLCGRSTSVAALEAVDSALEESGWGVSWTGVTGWHHHPEYTELRAANIRRYCLEHDLDPTDPDTILYFSAHGTPARYLSEGSRYDRYVQEHCAAVAAAVGADRWTVGFQNHTNRGVPWTVPDNEDRLREVAERRLIVEAVSFVHEQSETLGELDRELRDFAEAMGKEFHRVPVPHADPALVEVLRGVVEHAMTSPEGDALLARCRCHPVSNALCTNGRRTLPPSPFVPACEGQAPCTMQSARP